MGDVAFVNQDESKANGLGGAGIEDFDWVSLTSEACNLSGFTRMGSGAPLLSESGLVMDPVHSAGSVFLVFWVLVAVLSGGFCFVW